MNVTDQLVEVMARATDPEWWAMKSTPETREYIEYWQNDARKQARSALTALYTALQEEGLVVVPREPTEDMAYDGACDIAAKTTESNLDISRRVYASMLTVAPPPPGSTGE